MNSDEQNLKEIEVFMFLIENRITQRYLALIVCTLLLLPASAACAADESGIATPILKWQHGGCYSSWCETGWYSSPAVADLDGDGDTAVIASAYSVIALTGTTGELIWRAESGHDRSEPDASNVGRTWPGIVLADVDNDGEIEIVTAHGHGYVSIYNHEGYFEPGWPQHPIDGEFRSLAVADLDNDGDIEIAVGAARGDRTNVWVFEHDGSIRSGWPRLNGGAEGSAWGTYNDNIGTGDIDGDELLELIVPSDTITICAYEADGTQIGTHEMYHKHTGHDMDFWGEVPAYIDPEYELRGWGPCGSQFTARANFANGPANVIDVNGDGTNEIIVIGDVHNCNTDPYTDVYNTPYI